MGRITRIFLSEPQRAALERGHREGSSAAFGRRCQMILLKSQGRSSQEIAGIVGGCSMAVHNWVRRYQKEGLAGLETRPGQGRAPILDSEQDLERVRQAVAHNRQRLSVVTAELQTELGKAFCTRTLNRFVKKTVQDISASGAVHAKSQTRTFTSLKSSASKSSRPSPKTD